MSKAGRDSTEELFFNLKQEVDKAQIFRRTDAAANFISNNIHDDGQKFAALIFAVKNTQIWQDRGGYFAMITLFQNCKINHEKFPDFFYEIYGAELDENIKGFVTNCFAFDWFKKTPHFFNKIVKNIASDEVANGLIHGMIKNVEGDVQKRLEFICARFEARNSWLCQLLKVHNNESFFSAEGLEFLKNVDARVLVIRNLAQIDLSKAPLVQIFAYYDYIGKSAELFGFIAAKAKEKILEDAKFSKQNIFLRKDELSKLPIETDLETVFPEVKELSEYLHKRAGDLKIHDNLGEEYKINFADSGFEEAQRTEIEHLFKTIFNSENPQDSEILDFFSKILGDDLAREDAVSKDNKDKLVKFFKEEKNIFANLFAKKEGFANFVKYFQARIVECTANLKNQGKIALYNALLHDSADKVLFCNFMEKIFIPMTSSGGDIVHLFPDPLLNPKVNECRIVPRAFVEGLKKEFYDANSNEIGFKGEELFDKNFASAIYEYLHEKKMHVKEQNEAVAELAVYKVLEKAWPQILEKKELRDFKMCCNGVMNAVAENKKPRGDVSEAVVNALSGVKALLGGAKLA